MWVYIKKRSRIFYNEILCSAGILITLAFFIGIKVFSNIYQGAKIGTAIRSGVLGSLFFIIGYFSLALFAVDEDKIPRRNVEAQTEKRSLLLWVVLAYTAFIFLKNIDFVQRAGGLDGTPVMSFIPGYTWLMQFIDNKIAIPISNLWSVIKPAQVGQIIKGFLFCVLIPFLIFRKLGYTFKSRIFSMKHSRAAWPIIFIYLVMVLTNGLRVEAIWFVAYAFLHPALQEEFFDRGIIVPAMAKFFKNTGNIIVVSSLIFTILHFPDFFFRIYKGNMLATVSEMSSIMLSGILYAYGYRKTGSLMPMMIIHALEDATFLF